MLNELDNWSIENCCFFPCQLQLIGLCFEHQLSKNPTNRWDVNCTSRDATLHWPFHGPLGLSPSATAPKIRMKWKDVSTIEPKRAENVNDEFTAKKVVYFRKWLHRLWGELMWLTGARELNVSFKKKICSYFNISHCFSRQWNDGNPASWFISFPAVRCKVAF